MPRISDLSSLTTPSNDDELAIVDKAGAVTKKIKRGDLIKGTPLPADSVDTAAIQDEAVTFDKIADYESGSNANGSYVQFPDGTMICTIKRLQTLYASSQHTSATWTYPEAFTSAPTISITIDETDTIGVTATQIRYGQVISSQLSNSSAQIRVRCDSGTVGGTGRIYVYVTAIGTWK